VCALPGGRAEQREDTIRTLRQQVDAQGDLVARLRTEMARQAASLDAVRTKLREERQRADVARRECGAAQDAAAQARETCAEARSRVEAAQSAASAAQSSAEAAEREVAALRQATEAMRVATRQATARASIAEARVARAEAAREAAEREAECARVAEAESGERAEESARVVVVLRKRLEDGEAASLRTEKLVEQALAEEVEAREEVQRQLDQTADAMQTFRGRLTDTTLELSRRTQRLQTVLRKYEALEAAFKEQEENYREAMRQSDQVRGWVCRGRQRVLLMVHGPQTIQHLNRTLHSTNQGLRTLEGKAHDSAATSKALVDQYQEELTETKRRLAQSEREAQALKEVRAGPSTSWWPRPTPCRSVHLHALPPCHHVLVCVYVCVCVLFSPLPLQTGLWVLQRSNSMQRARSGNKSGAPTRHEWQRLRTSWRCGIKP